jgi:ribulose-5-phosphate 4-epimerase/fuculose-1-phosphate aldolase
VHYIMLTTFSSEGCIPLAPTPPTAPRSLRVTPARPRGRLTTRSLLQNHGTITIEGSAEEAFSRTAVLEEMAEIYYRPRLAGEPILSSTEQVEEVATKIAGYGQAKPLSADTR